MYDVSDDILYEAYIKAKKLSLEKDFIQLLELEINQRGLFEEVDQACERSAD